MAVLIKNQILKHLSKFTKNLSPDKLHLSTLKGHGELSNLELNEKVLTELLELPAWLRLTRATCNYVTLKIHWTKLKSVPIHLSLDEVVVVVETCEDLRPPTPMSNEHSYNSGGKYGFSDRVIDGMTVAVNSVLINFSSPAFQASFQLSRVVLESYSPDWKKKDLRLSRIKDIDHGELLLFKRLEWQMLRIEAKSRDNSANGIKRDIPLTPLRLITNQACCKITIKKKLSDCTVIGSRLVFVLDDLLWVLTDAQLVAALHFVQSLSGLVQKATQLTQKQKAKKKLEQQPDKDLHQNKASTRFSPVFHRNDVIETSYHVLCSRIDLHLCDDMDPKDGRSQHPDLREGGALQISLHKLVVDYYPYHRAFASREHWLRYAEPSTSHSAWVQQLLSLFYEKFLARGHVPFPSDGCLNRTENRHTSVYRVSSLSSTASGENITVSPSSPDNKTLTQKASSASTSSDIDSSRKSATSRKLSLQHNYRCLMSSCFVLRLEDIVAYKVSISKTTAAKKQAIEKFIVYNKGAHLPAEIKAIHLEHITYYLPGDIDYPVPSPNFFFYLGPLKLSLDTATVLWMNAFYLNLQKCLMSLKLDTSEVPSLVNVRVEALMPQIVIPSDQTSPTQPDRPKTLQMQASRIIATNCRVGEYAAKSHLKECIDVLTLGATPYETLQFPWHVDDKKPVSEAFIEHVDDHVFDASPAKSPSAAKEIISECTDIWNIHLDPFWAEFTICESGRTRLQSFIDPLPITLWFHSASIPPVAKKPFVNNISEEFQRMTLHGLKSYNLENAGDASEVEPTNNGTEAIVSKNEADIYILVHVHSLLNIQLTHFQYLFILRAVDIMVDLAEHLEIDTAAIIKDKPVLAMCVTTWWPQVEVSLVLRSLNQLSATSDSVDLASLQDDCSSNSEIVVSKKKLLQSQSSFSVNDCYQANAKVCSPEKSCGGILEDCCLENGLHKSCSDSLLNCHSPGSSQTPTTPIVEGMSEAQTITETNSPYKDLHSGTSAVKRGFCSLVASIDSAFTKSDIPSVDSDSISYPEEDTLSLKSDLSSDLDQFVLLNQDGALDDEFFHHPHAIEVADEAKEDSISNYTLNSEKKREMISVAVFKFSKVAFVMHSQLATCLIIQCNHIETKEESAISWENFQNVFSTRSRSWKMEKDNVQQDNYELSMRITQDASPESDRACPEPKYLTVSAQNLHLQFYMSSISALVDFFEDEVAAKSMPSKIILSNLNVQLQDDGSNSGMSPSSSVPLNISLPGCILERTLKGTLSVLPLPDGYVQKNLNSLLSQKMNMSPSSNTVSFSNTQSPYSVRKQEHCCMKCNNTSSSDYDTGHHGPTALVLKLLKDNDDLRSQLVSMTNLQQENESLKSELEILRDILREDSIGLQLLESKKEIKRIEEEKRTLQDTLKILQKDLNQLEMKNMPDFTQ